MKRREFLLASTAGVAGTGLAGQTPSAQSENPANTPANASRIFPVPTRVSSRQGQLNVTSEVVILVPPEPTAHELLLARSLRNEFADWYGLILKIERAPDVQQNRRAIVMGISDRPLVPRISSQSRRPRRQAERHAGELYPACQARPRCRFRGRFPRRISWISVAPAVAN